MREPWKAETIVGGFTPGSKAWPKLSTQQAPDEHGQEDTCWQGLPCFCPYSLSHITATQPCPLQEIRGTLLCSCCSLCLECPTPLLPVANCCPQSQRSTGITPPPPEPRNPTAQGSCTPPWSCNSPGVLRGGAVLGARGCAEASSESLGSGS